MSLAINNTKILVQWVTDTGSTVLQQIEVPLVGDKKDRIPLKAIREKWGCKKIVWIDVEEELEEDSKGHSAMGFKGMDKIRYAFRFLCLAARRERPIPDKST
jgi:hypothetical protein